MSHVGRAQAHALAQSLRGERIDAIYSSPRLRTRQTAQAIAAGRGLEVTVAPALDEIDFGEWTGCTFGELDGRPEWMRWNSNRATARCPGGESMGEALGRALRFAQEVAARHAGGTVVLVTHCDIIRALLCAEERRSLDDILSFEAEPASMTVVQRVGARQAAA